MSMYSNKEIFEGLLKHDPVVIKNIYDENHHIITRWIKHNSGNSDEADDLLHDALLIVLRKSKQEEIKLTCSFSTYLVSISKHLWFHELRRRQRLLLTEINQFNDLPDEKYDEPGQFKEKLLKKILLTLDTKERKLLELYKKKVPLSEIMLELGFRNKQAVADKKKNCIKKLRKNLLSCAEYKEFQIGIFENY
jgi:RNA polymerase sigma factor (sigma-70 family)